VDLWGRLSNPLEAVGTVAAQGFAASHGDAESAESRLSTGPESTQRPPPEDKGRLSNPIQRHLSPTEIGELIAAYGAGATINELAHQYGLHRTTVAAHLDRNHIERHHPHTEWANETLTAAADLYASGLSLAAVAARYGIDPQTVANRFRRAGIPVRTRRGWPPQHKRT
jgi:lambda repressor-like predicted transcriptional regulator